MSVIFGIKEEGKIVIAGDNRGSAKDGKILTDNMKKVTVINEHLAFASAGNAVFETAVLLDVNKMNGKEKIATEDLVDIILASYQKIRDSGVLNILKMPAQFYFLIAGKNRNHEASLISGGNPKGELDISEVPMVLFPPADADMKRCCDSLAKNYNYHPAEYVERTIREISEMSLYVSVSGDKWIYDILTGKGKLYSF